MTPQINTTKRTARVLAISTYELGHQPVVLAQLASLLEAVGVDYSLCDNSVANKPFTMRDDYSLRDGTFPTHIIISTPMHTATQLGRTIASRARNVFGNEIKIAAVGLYSEVALAACDFFDASIASITQDQVLKFLGIGADLVHQDSTANTTPGRRKLPGLTNYAHLLSHGEKKIVGYVESTIGCAHSCRHCPVPVIFHGKFKAVNPGAVLDQIEGLYKDGARHITFGDPDFLNGPAHALRIVRSMHASHPELTFDATVKVEHILEHPTIWKELRTLGLAFVTSAFEHTSNEVLEKLGKGHTRDDLVKAMELLRGEGIEVRPSLMPFTPWTDRESILDLIEFIYDHDLIESIDPVQMSIRMLVPLDSLVLSETDANFGPWNPELLSFEWHNSDLQLDDLQLELAKIAEHSEASELDAATTFSMMRSAIYNNLGMPAPIRDESISTCRERPRLSESWFCCAEPTRVQKDRLY